MASRLQLALLLLGTVLLSACAALPDERSPMAASSMPEALAREPLDPVLSLVGDRCAPELSPCVVDNLTITRRPTGCSSEGSFGTVTDDTLLDKPNVKDSRPLVRLRGSHFVCVLATVSERNAAGRLDPPWSYVVVVPTDRFQPCLRDPSVCAVNPGGTVERVEAVGDTPCGVDATSGVVTGGCAAGWIESVGDYGPGAG